MSLAKINGVSVASIGKINGIAKASIGKYNGIELPSGEVNTTIANQTYLEVDHYYDFLGDANDQVGTAHGTVYGATYVEDGLIDGSYLFDGSNDYIEFPFMNEFKGRKEMTIIMTLKHGSVGNVGRTYFCVDTESVPYYVYSGWFKMSWDKYRWHVVCVPGDANPFKHYTLADTSTVYQILVRINSSGLVQMYENNVLLQQKTMSDNFAEDTLNTFIIGYMTNVGRYFHGLISQLVISKTCISDEGKDWVYNNGDFRQGGYR